MGSKRVRSVLPVADFDVFVDESGQLNQAVGEVNVMAAVYMPATPENKDLVTDLVGNLRERVHGERSATKPVKAQEWPAGEIDLFTRYVRGGRWSVMYTPLQNDDRTPQAVVEIPNYVRKQTQQIFANAQQTAELITIKTRCVKGGRNVQRWAVE